MDAQEQLLQTLMRDLQSFQLPERWDETKKAQVMKGRKGQADIDSGRKSIEDNERNYQEALTKRDKLSERIQSLTGQVQTSKDKAAAESPYEQARQIALFGVPAAAGTVGGYLKGADISKALREKAGERRSNITGLADDVRSGTIPRRDAMKTAKSLRLLGPSRHGIAPLAFGAGLTALGAGQRAMAPNMTDNPIGQDVIRGFGGLESGIGMGLAAQQVGSIMKGVTQPKSSDVAVITGDGPPDKPPSTPPGQTTPAKTAAKPGSRTDLYHQAKARGLDVNTRTKKGELEQKLAAALKKSAKTAKKAPKALIPAMAGYGVYDALRSPAQASDGTPSEPMSRGEAAAIGTGVAGGTAATGAGLSRLGQALRGVAPGAMRIAGRALPPVAAGLGAYDAFNAIDSLAHLSPPQDPREFSTMGAVMPPEADPAYAPTPEPGQADAEFDALVTAAEQDPEIAALIQQMIQERVAAQPVQ